MNLPDINEIKKLEAERLEPLLNKIGPLKKLIEAIETRAKELLYDNPESFEGRWVLQPGGETRTISSTSEAADILLAMENNAGEKIFTPQDLLDIATFGIGPLEKVFVEKTGMPAKVAKDRLSDLLKPAMKIKQRQPSLRKGGV